MVEVPAADDFGPRWEIALTVPYGPEVERLGTADPATGPALGSEFGAPSSDGSWWILDVHKRRVARYGPSGAFLGAVAIPGRYMDLQLPFVVDGRWFIVNGAPDSGFVADAQRGSRVAIPESEWLAAWTHTDGHAVYGDDGTVMHVATADGRGGLEFARADSMRAGDGSRFLVRGEEDRSTFAVDLLDRSDPLRLRLQMTGPDGRLIEPGIEYAADASGSIHLLVYADFDGTQLAGYLSITPEGVISPIEPVANPFPDRSPGAPARLRVIPGTSVPAIMTIEDEAAVVRTRPAG